MSKQRNREEKIPVVPLYSGPVKVLAIPPFGASSNNGLWRAKDKPPVELVVANLEKNYTILLKKNSLISVKYHAIKTVKKFILMNGIIIKK